MKQFLEDKNGSSLSRLNSLAGFHDRVLIISVTNAAKFDSWKTPILITEETPERIAFQFDDVEDRFDYDTGTLYERNEDDTYFSPEMAKKICEFIRRHQANEDTQDLLVVNCQAGISRSGAISNFVREISGMSYDYWRKLCPQANPNTLVSKLLQEEWSNA